MPELGRRNLLKAAGIAGGASILTVGGVPATTFARSSRPVEHVTVFERGENGYHTFRIPVLVRATDGTVLAFAQGRVENAEDFGHIQLVLKRSTDGGRTWGPLHVVAADPPNRVANQSVVVDRQTGRIHVFVVRTGGDVTGAEIVDDTVSPEDALRPFVLTDALAGIRIGARIDGINHPFVGAVDEAYLFSGALTGAQIRAVATSNTAPDGRALVHLPMDVVR